MSELLSREKEFHKLNAKLDKKAKPLIEGNGVKSDCKTESIKNPSNRGTGTKEETSPKVNSGSTGKATVTNQNNTRKEYANEEHSTSLHSTKPALNSNRDSRPQAKSKVWQNKANTVPRNGILNNRKSKSPDLVAFNLKLNKKTQEALAGIAEDPGKAPNSQRSRGGASSRRKSPETSARRQSPRISDITETYRNENFIESPSTEAVTPDSDPNDTSAKDTLSRPSTTRTSKDINTISSKRTFTSISGPATRLPKKNLSSDGLIKFLKSKVTILQEELEASSKDLIKKTEELEKSYEMQKKLETQRDLAISKNNTLTEQLAKLEDKLAASERKLKEREVEFSEANRELESLKREYRIMTQANTNLEKRLYKANEDLENSKNNLSSLKDAERELKASTRQEVEAQERQIKQLKKQRSELLTAYKKQLYLVDNLRRQNVCMEQARMIAFGEKEFTKVLEWNMKN